MGWISTLTRMAGSVNPLTASLVTLQAELDAAALRGRLDALEDPISAIHADVQPVARVLYDAVRTSGSENVSLAPEHLDRFGQVLAVLEARGLVGATHTIGSPTPAALWISSPVFMLYMTRLVAGPHGLDGLMRSVEDAPKRTWLRGEPLAEEHGLPLPAVKAIFEVLESNGLGNCSGEIGATSFYKLF